MTDATGSRAAKWCRVCGHSPFEEGTICGHCEQRMHATPGRVTVIGFNYALDNGESLSSVKAGDELEYLKPHGGPFRVVENDGHLVTLERIRA